MDGFNAEDVWGVRGRMLAIAAMIAIGMLTVLGRVWYLQTRKQETLEERARARVSGALELRAPRGDILDRNGVELAVSTEAPSLFARPDDVRAPDRAAREIAEHLELRRGTVESRLRSDEPFVWLAREVDPGVAEAILDLDLEGVHRTSEHQRYYPLGSRAGQLVGFAGIDGQGLEGLERVEDEVLEGEKYEIEGRRDAESRLILDSDVPRIDRLKGNTVVLTLDERVQRVAERAVARQVEKYDARAGFSVVLEVETNEILAMTTTPAFDPNEFQSFTPRDWRLRPVTDVLEPGSVFKPFVYAAALDQGTIEPGTRFDCEGGRMRVGGHPIKDAHAHDVLTAASIIEKSSNIGIYKIARTLGRQRLYASLRAFGFGRRTGVSLPGERPGRLRKPSDWSEVGFANIAFGQGVSATPLQVASAVSAIANDGLLMKPTIIDEVRDHRGQTVRETRPTLRRRVVSAEAARAANSAMQRVMTEEGTGTRAMLEGFQAGGKTGTAQQVDPETGAYGDDNWVGSFAGFAPADSPEIAVVVMIDKPKETHYGGVVAGPAFREIAQKTLAIRGVEAGDRQTDRDGEESGAQGVAESSTGSRRLLSAAVGPDATDAILLPAEETTKESAPTVPDFEGMSLGAAVERASSLGVLPNVRGWGRVVDQSPPSGEPLDDLEELTLVLAPARRSGRRTGGAANGSASAR